MGATIEIDHVSKQFGLKGNPVVDALVDVSLVVAGGEMVAVTGRSGSGKSTLLHVASGLSRPTTGRVSIDGVDVSTMGDKAISLFRNQQMGFVFQSFFLEPSLAAWQNVALPLIVRNVPMPQRRDLAAQALQRVGMEDRLEHKPAQLSGGEIQRVCVARAVVGAPGVIFADEPTGNLDSHNGAVVMALLKDLSADGTTVVVVTHNLDDAAYCDRVVTMLDGRTT